MLIPLEMSSENLVGSWDYDCYFLQPSAAYETDAVERVEAYVLNRHLEDHPYFSFARGSKLALYVWLSQELVMTNAFSQIVLNAASRIQNVHVRACLASVAYGEHGRVRGGRAPRAHPALLDKLRASAGLPKLDVRPLEPTRKFIDRLCSCLDDPLRAIASIGVGNERLIVPEYQAVWACFETLLPKTSFAPFLKANLDEDVTHAALCRDAARQLIRNDEDALKYETAAIESVEARWIYFDELLAYSKNL